MWFSLWLLCVVISGCTTVSKSFEDLAIALNEAHISNCLVIRGTYPPFGTAAIYARAGDLDCIRLWTGAAY